MKRIEWYFLRHWQILPKFLILCPQMSFQLCCQVVELEIQREGNKPWGLRIVGGADVATVMKVIRYHISGYIWDQLCHPGWEGSWDWHSSPQGRPEGRGRVGGGAGGADHHDDPPPGHASVAFVCKLCRWYNLIKYLYHEEITISSVWSNVEMVQIGYLCFSNNKIMLHCYIWVKLI